MTAVPWHPPLPRLSHPHHLQGTYNPNQQMELNDGWQSEGDHQKQRRKTIVAIVHLMKQRNPNASPEWLRKVQLLARRLDEFLYRTAQSYEEYSDKTTLKERLQQVAVRVAMTQTRTPPKQTTQAAQKAA